MLPLHAQLVNDGATNTLASVTTNITGDVIVGTNGSFTLLVLSNNAVVTNFNNGVIGFSATAKSNEVRLTSATARWVMTSGLLLVGSNGSFNRLVVSDGALVQLTSSLGALGQTFASSNNEALVTGSNSLWNIPSSTLSIGSGGGGNRLVVSNGGAVRSFAAFIGASSRNNEVWVTGPGSYWTNQADLNLSVSAGSANNRLVVSNGGAFFTAVGVTVGGSSSSSNNRVVVDGGLLRATNATGTGFLDVRRGTNVLNAGLIEADLLLLTNALSQFDFNGGTFVTRGAVIPDLGPFVVGTVGSAPAVWDVRAGASDHVLTGPVSLGRSSPFNQLLVTNGALLSCSGGSIGLGSSSANSNTAIIAGPGSRWALANTLEVGSEGSFNSLVVSNGGSVSNNFGYVGQSVGNNLALVTGTNSVWTNASELRVGGVGTSNQLVVSNGGTVANGYGYFASGFNSSNNLALVTGTNSVWRNANGLYFGDVGGGNRLVVSNGGAVFGGVADLGLNASSSNNVVLVTGSGSVWSNVSFNVGRSGPGNQLVINSGGVVRGGTISVGADTFGSNNVVLVTDSGSALNSELYVGSSGARNQLVLSNAAVAQGSYGALGISASGSNNLAVVTGSGSVWSNAVELSVGLSGRSNQLVVSSGATLAAGDGFIGKNTNANRNLMILTDLGTRWLLNSNLYVGSNGALNQLIITNGALVADGSGVIGAGPASSNNFTLLTDSGSVWSNAGNFFVGLSGAGNQLVVSNNALLVSSNAWLGFSATSRSNVALVTGAGTTWTNRQTLLVGESGGGNRLTVSSGARIGSKSGIIGQLTSATNNEVVVTGPDSFWGTEQDLIVGGLGNGNRLVITNGGSVRNNGGAGIGTAMSSSNEVVVAGDGSVWSLGSTLFVGQVASGCRLVISNGGAVLQEAFGLTLGSAASSTNNRIQVDGGTLLVTNAASGTLDVRRGTTVLNSGLIEVSRFLLTNSQGFLQFNGGTFSTRNSTVGNGTLFLIGNGTNAATFNLAGNGLHEFNALLAAQVRSNATFTGNGTIAGPTPLQFFAGSRLVPGTSVGTMIFSNSPVLSGTIIMEISKNGATLTNDQIQVVAPLSYGGSLVVSNLGPTALAAGDRFQLFDATSYAGSFTTISLPPLALGLSWLTNLLVDGSIAVLGPPAIPLSTVSSGSYTQSFDSLAISGGANVWRDNFTLLGWYAAKGVAPSPITNYIASDGSANNGSLYSFGVSGSTERALGSIASDAVGTISYGLGFANDTAGSVSNFTVSYTGEQWRSGNSVTNTLTFWYRVSASAITNPEPDVFSGWTQVEDLDFASPNVLAPNTALNGNQTTNRQVFSSVLIPGLVVPPGQNVFFRWRDVNNAGANQGMAVDDLIVSFSALRPRLTIISTNGVAQLTGFGESNVTYGIEAASNLNAPLFWLRIGSNTANSSGGFQFTDTNAPLFPIRFYRALSP